MLRRVLKLFRRDSAAGGAPAAPVDLPWLPREDIEHLIVVDEGLPHVDWSMAETWIAHECAQDGAAMSAANLHRAVAAAWLDELRDAMTTDSRRWRSALVEGVAPLEGTIGPRIAACADRSLKIIGKALREIRGDPAQHPISPVGVLAFATDDAYYSFIAHFDEEGEYATSGGSYIHESADAFPVLAINAQAPYALEETVAHELTHHALRADRPALSPGLPLWAEEGLTQLMEEYVTRHTTFVLSRDMLERHRALWDEIGFDGFAEGVTFHSPEGEQQELSYHLAQALTRSLATTKRAQFFAFARACRNDGCDHDDAAREHLGGTVQELAEALVWGPQA